ncbi:hypothetical protein LTR56_018460 [Elasticomyces elasticus]|nr:hypothetical protein LTR56_018460 [Elasticomyces elasticus]KAK5751732.1 hypothetical protein LTS12_018207 [Elasticomyces elasticus]
MSYHAWPETGRSFDTAMSVAIWMAVASPAILGRWYVGVQRSQPLDLQALVVITWCNIAGHGGRVILNRLSGPTYWLPVGQDCSFIMWLSIYVVGLAVDLVVSALGVHCTFGLQMSLVRRLFVNAVFSADILVIVLAIYGLQYPNRRSAQIARDPTLHSTPFITANQIGLWVSKWCRFLEIAHGLRDEMGHATFGFGDKFSQVQSQRKSDYPSSGPKARTPAFASAKRKRGEEEEDEIELALTQTVVRIAKVESNDPRHEPWSTEGILQHRSYHVESEEVSF